MLENNSNNPDQNQISDKIKKINYNSSDDEELKFNSKPPRVVSIKKHDHLLKSNKTNSLNYS